MSSIIIAALPGVHGSLLGIGLSLFSVFAIYGYQKIQECLSEIELLLKDLHSITENKGGFFDEFYLPSTGVRQFNIDDFDDFLWKDLYPFFRSDEWASKQSSDASLEFKCARLLRIVEANYSRSPFLPKSELVGGYSVDRLYSIRNSLWLINYGWDNFELDIRRLANLCKDVAVIFSGCEDEFSSFFIKAKELRVRIVPSLIDVTVRYDQYRVRFDLARKLTYAMIFSAVIFVFGVLAPLIIADFEMRNCDIASKWSYILLSLSFTPYVLVWWYFCMKIRKL